MSHKPSSKPYKNSDFIRTLVSTQLLMELNLSEFIKSNQTIKLSKNYSLNNMISNNLPNFEKINLFDESKK